MLDAIASRIYMDSVDILSTQTDTHPMGAPACVQQGRKLPLFRGIHTGHRPHEVYSPGPINVYSQNGLIFIADNMTERIKLYTSDAYFITCLKLKRSKEIISLFAGRDALFVLHKNELSVSDGISCFTHTFSVGLTAMDLSEQFVYISTHPNCIQILKSNLDTSGATELSRSYLTEESYIRDFKVSDDSLVYAVFSRSTFPFQIFTVHGVFLRYISCPCPVISPLSISISKHGYTAISDGTSKSVKIFSPEFNIIHTLDGIFEIGRAIFSDNYILVTNSALGLNLHVF